ncbi:hypothetical protein GCM10027176_60020 [Actinoallomurus bryophytorum]|uniref:Uncharacterized protein n=2 Tax=Actinoallomurus bryophytorum TaxID=1490222 RepID=A0A543CR15_9ACTN|nr:hypothetical protein FB559_5058 [Actinoallomurus bryophytorum]
MLTGMAHLQGAPSRGHAPVRQWSRPERVELGDTSIPVRSVRRHVSQQWRSRPAAPGRAIVPEATPEMIVGYVDPARGSAAFHRLTHVNEGDRVKVVRRDHSTAWFKVDSVRRAVRRSVEQERARGDRPELRLISVRDAARRGGHADPRNVIVSAHLDRPASEDVHLDRPGVVDE